MLRFIEKNNGLSRKERERLYKKHEILNAAAVLFADKGFDGTKLDDIAVAAQFGKGTLYNYFKNKEDIYVEIINEISKAHMDLLYNTADKTDSLLDFITILTQDLLKYFKENNPAFLLLLRARIEINASEMIKKSAIVQNYLKDSHRIFKNKIKSAISNGEIREINPDYFIIMYRHMLFCFFHSQVIMCKTSEKVLKEATDFIIDTLFNGILNK